MEAPSDLNAWKRDLKEKTRIRVAFLFLLVFLAAGAAGLYYAARLTKLQDSRAAGESQSALQGVADQEWGSAWSLTRAQEKKFVDAGWVRHEQGAGYGVKRFVITDAGRAALKEGT